MEMNRIPTAALIELLNELEDDPFVLGNGVDTYLRIDDPASPNVLCNIYQAILDLNYSIPIFRTSGGEQFLCFSRFQVIPWLVRMGLNGPYRAEHYYIQTRKGRIRFPEESYLQVLKAQKAGEVTMKYKDNVVAFPLKKAS